MPSKPKKARNRERHKSAARRRASRQQQESDLAIIDRVLLKRIPTLLNGETARITVLAAIMHQLFQKELAGDARAGRVLLKFEDLAKRDTGARAELDFAEDEYSRSFSEPRREDTPEASNE